MSDVDEHFAQDFIESLKDDDGVTIITDLRKSDGYVNATRMCQSANTKWGNYNRNKTTQEYFKELSKVYGLKISEHSENKDVENSKEPMKKRAVVFSKKNKTGEKYLIEYQGGYASNQATYVHPDIAIDLASWISPKFHVKVNQLVRRYLTGEISTKESQVASKILNYYANIPFPFSSIDDLLTKYLNKSVVYFGMFTYEGITWIKYGFTDHIYVRFTTHKRELGSLFKFIKVFEVVNNTTIENLLKKELEARNVKKSAEINGKNQTELIELSHSFTYIDLFNLTQKLIDENQHPAIIERDNIIKEKDDIIKQLQDTIYNNNNTNKLTEIFEFINNNNIHEANLLHNDNYDNEPKTILNSKKPLHQNINKNSILETEKKKIRDINENEILNFEQENNITTQSTTTINEANDNKIIVKVHSIKPINQKLNNIYSFIEEYCELGIDNDNIVNGQNPDRFRVNYNELYELYKSHVNDYADTFEFKTIIKDKYNLYEKKIKSNYEKVHALVNIRLKEDKHIPKINNIVIEFLETKCSKDEYAIIPKLSLYDKFIEFAKTKEESVNNKCGFSINNFHNCLLLNNIEFKQVFRVENRQQSAYLGIYLNGTIPSLYTAMKDFSKLYLKSKKKKSLHVTELFELFNDYIKNKYHTTTINRTELYKIFEEINPMHSRTINTNRNLYNKTFRNVICTYIKSTR